MSSVNTYLTLVLDDITLRCTRPSQVHHMYSIFLTGYAATRSGGGTTRERLGLPWCPTKASDHATAAQEDILHHAWQPPWEFHDF